MIHQVSFGNLMRLILMNRVICICVKVVIFSILGEFLNLIDVLCVQLGDILSEVSLDLLQNPHGFGPINKIDCESMLAKSASPSNSVKIGFT